MSDLLDDEVNELAGHRNFYKMEKWSKDEQRIECMQYDKARAIFETEIKRRLRIRRNSSPPIKWCWRAL